MLIALIVISVGFLSGCFKTNNQTGNIIIMSAKQFHDDMVWIPSNTSFSMLYNSLEEGDAVIIQDSISEIQFDSDTDVTTVTFKWSEPEGEGTLNLTRYFQFEGNITQDYLIGDNVSITVHIKHVTFSVDNFEYDLEIFEEQWINQEYFSEHVPNFFLIYQGLKPMPQSCIEK